MPVKIIDVIASSCLLGEGIYYSEHYKSVFWVDIKRQQLYCQNQQSKLVKQVAMPEQIGWVKQTTSGRLIVGLQSGIYALNDDLSCGNCLITLPDEMASNRLNDAKTDLAGRLYFGTMDDKEATASGSLYQISAINRPDSLVKVDSDYIVSNGPAVNLAGDRLYSVSSATREIYTFKLDAKGQLSDKQVLVLLPQSYGYPDGITVDSRDNLWVACWQGHGLCCFNTAGQLILRIVLPAPQITNVTFAGPDYATMYVTSARIGMNAAALKRYPLSGSVFAIEAGVTGAPETLVNEN